MKKYILAILASTMLSATAFAGGVNIGITASIVDISNLLKSDFRGIIVSTIQKFEKMKTHHGSPRESS